MDRAHRLGQMKDVVVYRLICTSTIEENILQRAKEKKTVQQLVMTGDASKGDLFAPDEVISLLVEDKSKIPMMHDRKNGTAKLMLKMDDGYENENDVKNGLCYKNNEEDLKMHNSKCKKRRILG